MTMSFASLPVRAIDAAGLSLLLAISGASYLIGVHPALDRRAAAEHDRQALAVELSNAATAVQSLQESQRKRDALLASQASNLILESTDQVNARISRLTELAASEGIVIQQLTPGTPKAEQGRPFSAVPIRVQGTGYFADCVAFLAKLRAEHRDIAVPTINLSLSQPASEKVAARLDMTLDLVWYAGPDGSSGRK